LDRPPRGEGTVVSIGDCWSGLIECAELPSSYANIPPLPTERMSMSVLKHYTSKDIETNVNRVACSGAGRVRTHGTSEVTGVHIHRWPGLHTMLVN